jgi:hypothetical protein
MNRQSVIIALACVMAFPLIAQKRIELTTSAEKTAATLWQQFDGNRINAAISSSGPFADYLKTYSSGLEWPKGSGKTAIFSAGIWITGKHRASDSLRTAAQMYQTEYQPGPILTTYNTTLNDPSVAGNPHDRRYRVYKINNGDNGTTNIDYAEWPGDLGAPFIDINNNGVWDNGTDVPKVTGDQTLWTVYNDLDKTAHSLVGLTPPMGIEVQASYFGYDTISYLQDIMFMKWRIINKSDAVYDSVHFSIWSDTDMGDANDDAIGSDSILHLIYTYNGDEYDAGSNGYGTPPPANGFIILQGPAVPGTQKDSVFLNGRFVRGIKSLRSTSAISILKNYGYTIDPNLGMALFARQALYLQNGLTISGLPIISPYTGTPTKYMVSGDPVTETGWTEKSWGVHPGDRRSVISAGPFTLAAGDTQELYGAFLMAQGTDRLNSITELRKSAEAAYMVFRAGFPPAPTAAIVPITQNDLTVTVKFSSFVHDIPAAYTKITVYLPDTLSYLTKQLMFDDGTGDDTAAHDGLFTKSFTVPRSPFPYLIDLTVYELNLNTRWNKIGKFSTTELRAADPVIYSDNLNHDGAVNAGETVRFGLSIKNNSQFTHYALTLSAEVQSASRTLRFAQINPSGTVSSSYAIDDPASYLSFTVPLNYTLSTYTVHLAIADSFGNVWRDSVVFPVTKIQPNVPIVQQASGKSNARFDIAVTNPSAVKDHLYEIYGIDVWGHPSQTTYGIKDSTTGTVLAEHLPAVLSQNVSPTLPEYDGFKVLIKSIETRMTVSEVFSDQFAKWFSPVIYFDTAGTYSTVHFSDVPDIRIRFSVPLGYTDVNANGIFDPGEPYVTDSTNAGGSQRAYFYRQESGLPSTMHYVGYAPVPFTVHDVSGTTERQLTVIVNDRDKNSQWDVVLHNSTARNTVYVLSETYDPTGAQYDSSKGGTDLSNSLRSNLPIPLYYRLDITSVAGYEPLHSAGTWDVRNSHPFTSRDRFIFNPTVLTGVRENELKPVSYSLDQNFPNPFNPSTTIRFAVPIRTHVNLEIYNTLGQRLATLVNEVKNDGFYTVTWNGRTDRGISVASGMYFYQIRAGSFTAVRKMLLIK